MLKGIIYALGIQYKAIYVHLLCHWMIYPSLIYLWAFNYDGGIVGIWGAKVVLEISINVCYLFIIYTSDWEKIAHDAEQRQIK